MNSLFKLKKYLQYQWLAQTKYYLHSPFVYQFHLNVLNTVSNPDIHKIEKLRTQLRKSTETLAVEDFGTGGTGNKPVSALEQNVAVTEKYGSLLYRLVTYFKPKSILELGTSIGLSSSYIALANPAAQVISIEGSKPLSEMARKNHAALGIKNVEVLTGHFKDVLPGVLANYQSFDMILFDGNHRKEATLAYFNECLLKAHEHSVFIFDDIYWSVEMFEAWQQIKAHPQITLTIDVYQMGICFFTKEKLAKEDFVLRY